MKHNSPMSQIYRLLKWNILQNEFFKNCNLDIKLIVLLVISELGKITPKLTRHSSILLILFVLKNFIRNRLIAKSKQLVSDLDTGQTSVPHSSIGRHLWVTALIATSSEADLSIWPPALCDHTELQLPAKRTFYIRKGRATPHNYYPQSSTAVTYCVPCVKFESAVSGCWIRASGVRGECVTNRPLATLEFAYRQCFWGSFLGPTDVRI